MPAPMIATFSPGWTSATARGVQRAGERLDQHGVLVGRGRRGRCAAATRVRDEALAPAAAGVAAEAGLQAGGDVAVGRVAAQRGQALRALGARRSSPRAAQPSAGWTTTRSPRRGPAPISPTISWPGTNGVLRQRREVQRGLAGEQREVGAADAGQARADRQPVRAGRARRADLLERQRAGAGQARARRDVASASARRVGQRLQTAARSVRHSSIGQRRRRASRARRKSGLIACGWPTSSSSGRSARLSP